MRMRHIGNSKCRHNAISPHLRCAINPSGLCQGCPEYERVSLWEQFRRWMYLFDLRTSWMVPILICVGYEISDIKFMSDAGHKGQYVFVGMAGVHLALVAVLMLKWNKRRARIGLLLSIIVLDYLCRIAYARFVP